MLALKIMALWCIASVTGGLWLRARARDREESVNVFWSALVLLVIGLGISRIIDGPAQDRKHEDVDELAKQRKREKRQ